MKSGDRTGTLLAAIVNYVAPRLRISAPSQWPGGNRKPPRKPCKVAQLLSMGLTSGKVIDPRTMGLHEVDDEHFLTALADALDSALIHGLDVARRLEWNGESKLYQLGQLYRAYFVTEAERRSGEHEPDEFHEGIAPCVKLLHFVADRLAKLRASASRQIVARWALTPSPIHTRLWAALARDPWIASGADASNFLEHLDDHRFWDAQNFPEVAELRAVRFRDLSPTMQQSLTTRLRKLPRRNEWPLGTDPMRLARGRLYWGLREIGRIKVAGGVLPAQDERWFTSEIANFPELAQMNSSGRRLYGDAGSNLGLPPS